MRGNAELLPLQVCRAEPLFPESVAHVCIRGHDAPGAALADDAMRGILRPPELENAVPKRQVEFFVGRTCAREAMRLIDPELALVPIRVGAHREPVWPTELVGAITHTAGYAAAAVGRAEKVRGLGLDAERVIAEARLPSIAEQVVLPDEDALLARQTSLSEAERLALVFSAKESLFKCLFPHVKRFWDFLDAELVDVRPAQRAFSIGLRISLTPELRASAVFHGRFRFGSGLVHTGILWV